MASSNSSALILPATPPTSMTNSAAEEIHDIKAPVPIASGWFWWGLLAGALALAALAYGWSRRKKAPKVDPALLIPAHRRAKERLRGATELLSDPYKFCSLVSDVTRTYLEERFNLHAPERTTDEFLSELRESSVLKLEHKLFLEDFLTRCDLVKFARHEPMEPELRELLEAALRLIDETKEVQAPTEAAIK